MSLPDNAEELQELFYRAGFNAVDTPYDTSELTRPEFVQQCSIIARNGDFVIIYAEATSNWRQIAADLLKKAREMCLVAMHAGQGRYVFSTLTISNGVSKPMHVVINSQTKRQMVKDFISGMRIPPDIIDIRIPIVVERVFAMFDLYAGAIGEFGENLEVAIRTTRAAIEKSSKNNKAYDTESARFLSMCRKVISDRLEPDDIPEMLLQHILTYRIFELIYDEHDLHSTNAVARSLGGLLKTLDIDAAKMRASYRTIELVADLVTDEIEKQNFLKQIYETFYEKYDPDNADKWGIVYTPSEVVDFMVRSTEYLLSKHFKKCLSDDDVTMLDPATGTGTFVTSILRHLKPSSVETKYRNDIFANEVSILAYYIAALNIENTYHILTGRSCEFENICWMDTLESGTKNFGKLSTYFPGQDNIKRISRQQTSDICVVIGNPPYNAFQDKFNKANPSDKYPDIDKRIEETYVKESSTRNKNQQYDMYKRFLRWSSERIKDNGMVAFVSNNSFLDAKADDGTRKVLYEEFDHIYTVNLKGNTRIPSWREEGGKVFAQRARVGITITFFIKTGENSSNIQYAEVQDYMNREDKLKWLTDNSLSTLQTEPIVPKGKNKWLNQTDSNFDDLIPVISDSDDSIFEEISSGVTTQRDSWAHDFSKKSLKAKIKYFIGFYNKTLDRYNIEKPTDEFLKDWVGKKIKWSDDIFKKLTQGFRPTYENTNIKAALYRPFTVKFQYFDKIVVDRERKFSSIFTKNRSNKMISFSNPSTKIPFQTLAATKIMDKGCIGSTQCIPLYMYRADGKAHSNVTKFGLELFHTHYSDKSITDEDVFYYTYAMFNDPKYQEKYKFDLESEFPRIPLAKNFQTWAQIGKRLYDIHTGFDDIEPYQLKRVEKRTIKNKTRLSLKKPKNETDGSCKIIIDNQTTLEGIPDEAVRYKFSSKCALEWILEFYKETKNTMPKDSCDDERVRNTLSAYRFSDYKERVIDLLQKVTAVSVETMRLRAELKRMQYGSQSKWNLQTRKTIKRKIPGTKKSKKVRPNMPQDTIDGLGQKRLL